MFATLESVARSLQAGDLVEAESLCTQVLKRQPQDPQALHLMGLIVHHGGRPGDAVRLFRKAIKRRPDNPVFHFNLGECYRAAGDARAAIASYRQALGGQPDLAEAHAGIGEAWLVQARSAEAEKSFRSALASDARLVAAWNGLGIALREQGRIEEAVEGWRRALALDSTPAVVHNNLGLGLRSLGRIDEAVAALVGALEIEPDNATIRHNFAECLKNRPVTGVTPGLRRQIEICFEAPGIDTQSLVAPALGALEADDDVAGALALAADGSDADLEAACAAALWGDALFLGLLETTFLAKPAWERLLTRARAMLLARPAAAPSDLLVALAVQFFNNEYAFASSRAEEDALAPLRRDIEARLAATPAPSPALERDLARLGMYTPLHALDGCERLLEPAPAGWSAPFQRLLAYQLREPLEEREIRDAIPPITAQGTRASAAVREMYEENPYPRWITVAGRQAQPVRAVLAGLFPHFQPAPSLRDPLAVLVAGCGTGKQAISAATRFKDCRVLAVDLSLASLAYGARMARKLGVDNIEFRQGDIRDLGAHDGRFHLIDCVGVLHHLSSEDEACAAWRLLHDLLEPRGLMKIGLYSETARRHVVAARDFIAAHGYPATAEGIRRCRQDIIALPDGRIERKLLQNRDFYSTSSCRDLIFHVHELRYTLPLIADMLEDLGLRFVGFELNRPEELNAYREAFPDDAELTDLANWHRFEHDHPDTFVGMYQFWCQMT